MGKKQPIRVALDLETTGLHEEQDAIVEVAAIKFRGDTIVDTFETLVAPGRPIPYRVQRLTGITPQQLLGAPQFEAIARTLRDFIGDLPLVGHSIPFDAGFLRRRGLGHNNPLIDTFELATVLLPSLPGYNLGKVADALGIPVSPGRHRAMVDTTLAKDVFLALHARLQAVDLSLLEELARLDAPRDWPLLAFFRQELRERQELDGVRGLPLRGSLGDRFAAQLGMDPRILSFAIARQPEDISESSPSSQVSAPALEAVEQLQTRIEVIPEQGVIPEQISPHEPMTYQAARKAVLRILAGAPVSESQNALLMEVTLGGNDYTPVLLPALEWLCEASDGSEPTEKRLVIACSNQQNARQLMEHLLPHLWGLLKQEQTVAYLAERGGYLCTHRWFGAALRRTSGELKAEQARGLAKLGLWAQQTLTGERSEISLLSQETLAWERVSSGIERIPAADERSGSAYQRCVYRRKGYCFVSRAEERVKTASVIVTTHAGLLDDLSRPVSLLASIERRIILDADLLEDELSRWSTADLDRTRLINLLNTIGTELPGERYQGLLALAAPALRENGPGGLSATLTVGKAEIDARMRAWFQTLHAARAAVETIFAQFNLLLEEFVSQGSGNGRDKGHKPTGGRAGERTDQPLRITDQTRNFSSWANVERAWQQVAARLQAVIDLAREAERALLTTQHSRHHLDIGNGEEDSIVSELASITKQLSAQKQLGQQALVLNENKYVYWLKMPQTASFAQQRQAAAGQTAEITTPTPILYTQPVDTAALSRRFLLNNHTRTIFSGIGLAVDNHYTFSRGRFGIENDHSPALSVVTEHQEQTLLYLPNDVPEPNMPQYQRHLDEALINLASALEGQTLVLFTSHAALRSSYASIKPVLEARGILVLGQGMDGSPRQLWQTCATQERLVVLGAGSFWDMIGETRFVPTCTVIARLPMPALNDPPLAARAEHYSDQLHQFTVPVAALRLRRALNRIAWSERRRNVVVLFDRRIVSKEYGATMLHTLPHCSQRQGPVSHLPETVLDWLTSTGSWDNNP
ncbi:MAG: exonuclease domain-containing protein [Ktedonobacteraceae bacterium]